MSAETGRITTDIPARLDRLPWARWHWMVVIGLGTVWILDGLEVTIVGWLSDALKPGDTGLGLSSFDVGLAGAVYVAGACVGALFFGQLTDRFGRKKLFLLTLGVYTAATVLTAFSLNPTWYFVARFFTGTGIGGEYAAINSAIDELIPASHRGRVDVAINGSFWIGAAGGSLLTIPLLDPGVVDQAWGWRLAFGLGAVLAVGILVVRRHVPRARAGCSSTVGRTRRRRWCGASRPRWRRSRVVTCRRWTRPSPSASARPSACPRSPAR
jgi:MFS family permease